MVIEWLGFEVKPELREQFITEDEKIWTPVLADSDGFLGKEIWIDPGSENRIYLIIRWQTQEQWNAVPNDLLRKTETEFLAAMGEGNYQMLESKAYQVRKFP
jgi:uncharacterized protein (TIGR03792 family)